MLQSVDFSKEDSSDKFEILKRISQLRTVYSNQWKDIPVGQWLSPDAFCPKEEGIYIVQVHGSASPQYSKWNKDRWSIPMGTIKDAEEKSDICLDYNAIIAWLCTGNEAIVIMKKPILHISV